MTKLEVKELFLQLDNQITYECKDSNAYNCEGDCSECKYYAIDKDSYNNAITNILKSFDDEYPKPYERLLFKTIDVYGEHWYIGEFFYDFDNKPVFYTSITEKNNGLSAIENYYLPNEVIDWMYLEDCLNMRKNIR